MFTVIISAIDFMILFQPSQDEIKKRHNDTDKDLIGVLELFLKMYPPLRTEDGIHAHYFYNFDIK